MKIHHICAATLCPLSRRMVNQVGGFLERGHMVCHCWLVESPDGLILVDTGVGQEDLKDPSGRLGTWFEWVVKPRRDGEPTALDAVRRLGFSPQDVRHIIPTHLDLDHAGGLPDLPWATVHVFADELRAALHPPTHRERERYRPAHFAHRPHWDERQEEGEGFFGFRSVQAMSGRSDVLLIPLTGHTRGHCGVAVKQGDGWRLHAGDAYFHHSEVSEAPHCPPGLQLFQRLAAVDNPTRLHNRDRLRQLALQHGGQVSVHSAHCPVEFERARSAQTSQPR